MLNKAIIYIIQWPTKEVTNSFMFILYLKRKKTTFHFGFLSFMVFSILQCLKVNLTSALNEMNFISFVGVLQIQAMNTL